MPLAGGVQCGTQPRRLVGLRVLLRPGPVQVRLCLRDMARQKFHAGAHDYSRDFCSFLLYFLLHGSERRRQVEQGLHLSMKQQQLD